VNAVAREEVLEETFYGCRCELVGGFDGAEAVNIVSGGKASA
jgi:hypothetical protein